MEASVMERASDIDDGDIVTRPASFITSREVVIIPVPYGGDEQSTIHEYQTFMDGDFWINKPA